MITSCSWLSYKWMVTPVIGLRYMVRKHVLVEGVKQLGFGHFGVVGLRMRRDIKGDKDLGATRWMARAYYAPSHILLTPLPLGPSAKCSKWGSSPVDWLCLHLGDYTRPSSLAATSLSCQMATCCRFWLLPPLPDLDEMAYQLMGPGTLNEVLCRGNRAIVMSARLVWVQQR